MSEIGPGSGVPGLTGGCRPLPYGPLEPGVDQVAVRMRDGVTLATAVYLPRLRTRQRVPTILFRVPYDKAGDDSFIPAIARHFTEFGFAAVGQDVRGKVRSGGTFEPFVHEVADAIDTLDWIAAQSWSNGAVGAMGDSYNGLTAWATAIGGHPALRAIVPRVVTTFIDADWFDRQGVVRLSLLAGWASFALVGPGLFDCELDWAVRPLRDLLPRSMDGLRSNKLDEWMAQPLGSQVDYRNPYGADRHRRVRAAVLHWGGWWDFFIRGQLRDWSTMAAQRRAGPQQLIVGASDHEFHEFSLAEQRAPDHMVDLARRRDLLPAVLEPAIGFFRDTLGDAPAARSPLVRWQLTNAGWRLSPSWPPPEARPLILHLAEGRRASLGPEGGALSARPERLSSGAAWTHDPANLVPSSEEPPWKALAFAHDERDVETREDVLTFTADERREALDLAGSVRAILTVTAQAPSVQIVAKLVDVCPDGRAYRIVEGVARVLDPSTGPAVEVDLGPTGYRVLPGHRLRLEVAASAFPRYLWHPGTDEDPWLAVRSSPVELRLVLGGGASRLELSCLAGFD